MKLHLLTFLGLVLITMSGCRDCFFEKGADREATIKDCSSHHGKEDACNASVQTDGRRCQFDRLSSHCLADSTLPPKDCEKMSEDACRASKHCIYKDASTACDKADPALAGKCEVIQSQEGCKADQDCLWNDSAVVCEDKK